MEACELLVVLGAAALGGAISFLTTYGMARRAEKAAAQVSAMLLSSDLRAARALLDNAMNASAWWPDGMSLPDHSWTHDVRAPLALFLREDEWLKLRNAFEEIVLTNDIVSPPLPYAGRRPFSSAPHRRRAEMTHTAVTSALEVLSQIRRDAPKRLRWRHDR